MKFIKLTRKNSDKNNIYLSIDEIAYLEEIRDSNDNTKHFCTKILIKNSEILSVNESPEEIMKELLNE